MKKIIFAVLIMTAIQLQAQQLPKDVEKVYQLAEKQKKHEEYKQAIVTYKEVLRSVEHVASCESIGQIAMELMTPPNYRIAYEFYDRAIKELERQIGATDKKRVKADLAQHIERLIPKRNKAKSYVDDFDKAKDQRQDGNRLMEDKDVQDSDD
jgi:hypothetical protein